MQRRWIREIKLKVEEERGGRLGKLEELSSELKKLKSIALDNADYLDENLRLHATWASWRALVAASVDTPVRRPFRDELRVELSELLGPCLYQVSLIDVRERAYPCQ